MFPFVVLWLCFATIVANSDFVEHISCEAEYVDVRINKSSLLFGKGGNEYHVEVEGLDIYHTDNSSLCPRWHPASSPFVPFDSIRIIYSTCNITLSVISTGKNIPSTLFANLRMLARSVDKETKLPIPGGLEHSFTVACYYEVRTELVAELDIRPPQQYISSIHKGTEAAAVVDSSEADVGDDIHKETVSADGAVDLWLTDRAGRNVTLGAALRIGTPLTLRMEMSYKGFDSYADFTPVECAAAPKNPMQGMPIYFVQNYSWVTGIFDALSPFKSIARKENWSHSSYGEAYVTVSYEFNFTAFPMGWAQDSVVFRCSFKLCLLENKQACNKTEQAVPYIR